MACLFAVAVLCTIACDAIMIPTAEIAPGVHYPIAQMGTCTTCSDQTPCCGTNLSASLPAWSAAQPDGAMAIDTQLR